MRLAIIFLTMLLLVKVPGAFAQVTSGAKVADSPTTRAASSNAADLNEPFFSERYLSADQRLARRQQRILNVLKSPDPLTTSPASR